MVDVIFWIRLLFFRSGFRGHGGFEGAFVEGEYSAEATDCTEGVGKEERINELSRWDSNVNFRYELGV